MLLFLLILFLLCGPLAGGYYGGNRPVGYYGGSGIGLGTVLFILLVIYMLGGLHSLHF